MLDDDFRALEAVMFDEFGQNAIYNGGQACRIIIDDSVEQFNEYGQVAGRVTQLTASKTELPVLDSGDQFDAGEGQVYTLRAFVREDADTVTWVV